MPTLKALRADHLSYIQNHIAKILFGGPARGDGGVPQEMIIILRTDDRSEAEAFIRQEPYTVSTKVFSEILIRPWSQIVPEVAPGALKQAIDAERAKAESER